MKIICLTHYYIEDNRAGGELMLHTLLKALADAGHEVTALITGTTRPDTVIDGVQVVYGAKLWSCLDDYEYDVLISQFQNAHYSQGHARKRGKPFVHIVHNNHRATKLMCRKMNRMDLNIFNTAWVMAETPSPARGLVVHPQVDEASVPQERTGEYVTLVNLIESKGSPLFYELAARMPDTQFMGVRGGYKKDEQIVRDMPNVKIIDNTPDMAGDVYSKSKVVLMPSSYESYGMVAAEAAASGIPVIAAPTPGLLENLGEAGVFVPLGEEHLDAWEDALTGLLNDDAKYEEITSRARSRAATQMEEGLSEVGRFLEAVNSLRRR